MLGKLERVERLERLERLKRLKIFKHCAFLAKAYLGIIRHLYVGLSTFTLFIIRLYILSTISYLPTMKVLKNCVIFGLTLCTLISISFTIIFCILFWSNVKDTFYLYLFVGMLWFRFTILCALVVLLYQNIKEDESMPDPEEV